MPSNFNGIEITDANFNGTALDLIYMNGVEVFSAAPLNEYFFNFDAVNQDSVSIPNTSTWVNRSEIDFEVEIASFYGGSSEFFVGKSTQTAVNGFIRLFKTSPTNVKLQVGDRTGGAAINEVNITVVDGQKHLIKIENLVVYLDGNVVGNLSNTECNLDANPFYIGRRANVNTGQFTGSLTKISVNGENFPLTEGSGFEFTGSIGTIGTGFTSNAGGLTYWNSTVWTLIP